MGPEASMNSTRHQEVLRRIEPHGQTHVVAHLKRLDAAGRARLLEQLEAIDFGHLQRLFQGDKDQADWADMAQRAESPPAVRLDGQGNRFSPTAARARGERALREGKVATLLVAGGQGTRLGFEHPKGMFPIGPVSEAPLFKILLEKVRAAADRYGRRVPLFLMTSPATHDETVAFLAENNRFGLPEEDLFIFCQGTMPAVDAKTGQVLLAEPDELFASPDGHGGMLAGLARAGGFEELRKRGIEQIFYFQVDNPLSQICDAQFLGYHLLEESELSTQVIAKTRPAEKVGNVVSIDGQVRIIEYSDLPAEVGERRRPDGGLELWAGNTAIHIFDVAFLERVRGDEQALPFHRAHKAVPYIDEQGRRVEPSQPNAIKFERFIFDLLPAARRAIVVEVDPAEGFAPVKNAPGAATDSPEIVRRMLSDLYRRWLTAAGAQVAEGVNVEISPRFALDAEETARKIKPGTQVTRSTYFG